MTAEQHLSTYDPVMRVLVSRHGPCTIRPHDDYYRELVDAIISQQLSVKAGRTIFNRFLTLFNGNMPTPAQIIATPADELRSIGCSHAKARYIQDLAQHIESGKLKFDELPLLANEDIISRLTDVKGIGVWTAQMFLIFSLGRQDILPTGDLGVRKAMMELYDLPDLPDPITMRKIAHTNHWTPYESVASWYLWKSLDNA